MVLLQDVVYDMMVVVSCIIDILDRSYTHLTSVKILCPKITSKVVLSYERCNLKKVPS